MRILSLLALCALPLSVHAQSNTVSGLDGRLTVIDNLTYYGRRGPAYPNGEIGMAMLNTMCNPGSVNIPWYQAMQPDHPKFGFLIVRVADDRIEQINEWSFCKHAFTSINVNGACGSCQNPGTGSLMGLNCSDTYGAGNNASRTWLGPPQEIDPWLGTWNPVGSYFDIGDPAQPGYPAAADGVRSLNQNIFDSVDNRVTVDEVDLTTANASYYYALQLIHQGEALANRGDNNAHRGFTPSWNGSTWSFGNNAEAQEYGSVLTRWPGAMVESGHDGSDDGRFYVASKVTPIGGGSYHYEYAVHNVDNSRAGAEFRIPIDATATATNFTFGDIDTDAGNDWSAQRIGNEIVFSANPNSQPLEWNTIYNFGFDADYAPGASMVEVVHARPGPGQLAVQVQGEVPGGTTIASVSSFGQGCPGSTQLPVPACASYNVGGGVLVGTATSEEYIYRVGYPQPVLVSSFDVWTRSTTSQTVQVQAYLYGSSSGVPQAQPLATTTLTVGPQSQFYTATFATPVAAGPVFYLGFDNTAQNVVIDDLVAGTWGVGYRRATAQSPWSLQLVRPAYEVHCSVTPTVLTPAIGSVGLPQLGSSYDVSLSDGLASSAAALASGFSDTSFQGVPLPAPLPGAPGCEVLVAPLALDTVLLGAAGDAAQTFTVPSQSALLGVVLFHQWVVLDPPANALGVTVSDALRVTIGT